MDWLPSRYRYGSLCAAILRECYSQRSLRARRTHRQSVLHLEKHLEGWVRSLPGDIQVVAQHQDSSVVTPNTNNTHADTSVNLANSSTQQRRNMTVVLFQYHEAMMAIHTTRRQSYSHHSYSHQSPQLRYSRHPVEVHSASANSESSTLGGTSNSTRSASHSTSGVLGSFVAVGNGVVDDPWSSYSANERVSSSARKLLAESCHLVPSDVLSHPHLYRLVCVAACTLAAATIQSEDPGPSEPNSGSVSASTADSTSGSVYGSGGRIDLSYLATASGFLGRMVLAGIEGPQLEEITEVVRAAQQSIKEKQRH